MRVYKTTYKNRGFTQNFKKIFPSVIYKVGNFKKISHMRIAQNRVVVKEFENFFKKFFKNIHICTIKIIFYTLFI